MINLFSVSKKKCPSNAIVVIYQVEHRGVTHSTFNIAVEFGLHGAV